MKVYITDVNSRCCRQHREETFNLLWVSAEIRECGNLKDDNRLETGCLEEWVTGHWSVYEAGAGNMGMHKQGCYGSIIG